MPTESALHVLFESFSVQFKEANERLNYLVARMDDVYDRVGDMGRAMQASEDTLSKQIQAIEAIAVSKADCANCQKQWVSRRWFVATGGFLILVAGIAGDWVDALAKMGWRP